MAAFFPSNQPMESPMASPLFQTAPLVFICMSLGFGLVLAGCTIADALRR